LAFISADNHLNSAAAAEGLSVDNPNNHPWKLHTNTLNILILWNRKQTETGFIFDNRK
jgi:hypothetical protein